MRPPGAVRLRIVPITLREAHALVARWHRHHRPSRGGRWAMAVADESGAVRGVAVVGRPVARMSDDGTTVEVTRVATDGCPNACSALLSAVRRAAAAMGFARVLTYTLEEEGGASLRAAGWTRVGTTEGGAWSRPSRSRSDSHPTQPKVRWEAKP